VVSLENLCLVIDKQSVVFVPTAARLHSRFEVAAEGDIGVCLVVPALQQRSLGRSGMTESVVQMKSLFGAAVIMQLEQDGTAGNGVRVGNPLPPSA
jgi:hypothetical protein